MRLRNVPDAQKILEAHDQVYIKRPQDIKGKWASLFENDNPLHLEIGMGKGQFLLGMAQAHPEINFIGIERYESVLVRALQRVIQEENITNIRLLKIDATYINDYFAPQEIAQLYLNFSDPWPKSRHAKRRLTSREFLARYKDILVDGAEIWFKSDNRHLFEFSLLELNAYGMVFEEICLNLHQDEFEENVRTEYEETWSAKGFPIFRIVVTYPSEVLRA